MRFPTKLLNRIDLESYTNELTGERYYISPNGIHLPSVTTVLSKKLPKEGLDSWRKKIGDAEADAILKDSLAKGTAMHKMLEDYVLGKNDYIGDNKPNVILLFKQLKPYLNSYLKEIYGIEINLYSERLKTAGTSDLVGSWDGIPSIIDYKNARSKRKEEWIENYFIQSSTYAMMVNEMYNLNIKQIVLMIAVNLEVPQIFIKQVADYESRINQIFL